MVVGMSTAAVEAHCRETQQQPRWLPIRKLITPIELDVPLERLRCPVELLFKEAEKIHLFLFVKAKYFSLYLHPNGCK
jgi:hypothetical protein